MQAYSKGQIENRLFNNEDFNNVNKMLDVLTRLKWFDKLKNNWFKCTIDAFQEKIESGERERDNSATTA